MSGSQSIHKKHHSRYEAKRTTAESKIRNGIRLQSATSEAAEVETLKSEPAELDSQIELVCSKPL